ncbi:MAG: hypothetical protein ACK5Z5_04710 [Neisseriaceae bacterium]|jgi:hypothetical protein
MVDNVNSMYRIKHLEWIIEEEDVFAESESLPWVYYITPIDGKFKMVVMSKRIEWVGDREFLMICDSLTEAQIEACRYHMKKISKIVEEHLVLY